VQFYFLVVIGHYVNIFKMAVENKKKKKKKELLRYLSGFQIGKLIAGISVEDPGCFFPGSGSDHFLVPDPDPNILSSPIPDPT
jgi:hypothetical protein